MFTVHVNGRDCRSEKDKSLLRFLRDDLHLTAAKDGCSLRFGGNLSFDLAEFHPVIWQKIIPRNPRNA